jgi:glutaredoxin
MGEEENSRGERLDTTTQLTVYTLEFCPNCELLKEFLADRGISFVVRDLSTAESLTELRVNGVFVNEAPVLQNDDRFLTSEELFLSGKVREDQIMNLIKGV